MWPFSTIKNLKREVAKLRDDIECRSDEKDCSSRQMIRLRRDRESALIRWGVLIKGHNRVRIPDRNLPYTTGIFHVIWPYLRGRTMDVLSVDIANGLFEVDIQDNRCRMGMKNLIVRTAWVEWYLTAPVREGQDASRKA